MFPAKYSALIWNECNETTEHVTGITFGENYADAMKNIEAYYGDELIEVTIELQEEATVYEVSSEKVE